MSLSPPFRKIQAEEEAFMACCSARDFLFFGGNTEDGSSSYFECNLQTICAPFISFDYNVGAHFYLDTESLPIIFEKYRVRFVI
jgi:hypothetical protein